LLDAGFRPTELLFHHEGDSIELTGPNGAIVFEFGPQFGMIAAWAQLTSYVGSLEDLPGGGPAPVGIGELPVTISPEAVEAWNKRWAEKLRANIHLIS
jgi:hypothetical protein